MKGVHILAISTALLCGTGCYNLVVINVGVGNKSAAAVAAPIDPVVECAALATASITFSSATKLANADQVQNCQEVIAAEQREKGKRP